MHTLIHRRMCVRVYTQILQSRMAPNLQLSCLSLGFLSCVTTSGFTLFLKGSVFVFLYHVGRTILSAIAVL